ncbi:PAS/PAC sensor signal transduction histidine kinase [Spirochaeta thermophila DSM 6578]|uniref:histidine kinase n=1 Tax=Winmispira thermophila (strain ATCC 700085 / DSM 6578 / Z-1203) TaxID=869211 RepID=G0GDG5_WINT7|nr:ATP-binding protein [Spirochaeta thermophila]AEJ60591.1 PAS/PAC sensor signal transduction histidine kinase [Spirochaeta thermophila DSM 6578]
MENEIRLLMRTIHYHEGNQEILKGVDFELRKGEIHALVGEHRCGKSTLMHLLIGEKRLQKGEILFNGRRIQPQDPSDAYRLGIAMVHQTPQVIPSLNAVENIFATRLPPFWSGLPQYYRYIRETRHLLALLGKSFDVLIPLKLLPATDQHAVDIARALSYDPDILILDEISNRQTPEELERLFAILKDMTSKGKSIIYVTPHIDEIFSIADRVTVLKNGYRQSTEDVHQISSLRLFRLAYSLISEIEPDESAISHPLISSRLYSEHFLRELPVGIILLNETHSVYYLNPAAESILDLPAHAVSGRPIHTVITPEQCPHATALLSAVYHGKKRKWRGVPFGKALYSEVHIYPLREGDELVGTVIMIEDRSLDHHIKEYLSSTERRIATAEVAAEVAHEINNPLGIISAYIEVLKLQDLSPEISRKLEKIQNEITRIQNFVSSLGRLADASRMERGTVDLVEMVKDVLLLFQHLFQEKRITVYTDLPETPVRIEGDAGRLKQLLINLVLNSVEALLHGGWIRIRLERKEGKILLSVSDNGHGIPKEIQDRIFRPFFSTKAGKQSTGLGLAICEHIAKLHGGEIGFTSTPGEITTFTVTFPARPVLFPSGKVGYHRPDE